jgi:hypothetical protein
MLGNGFKVLKFQERDHALGGPDTKLETTTADRTRGCPKIEAGAKCVLKTGLTLRHQSVA